MTGEPNPVVGDAALRVIVSADFFAAVAAAYLRFAIRRQLCMLLQKMGIIRSRTPQGVL